MDNSKFFRILQKVSKIRYVNELISDISCFYDNNSICFYFIELIEITSYYFKIVQKNIFQKLF